jgi:ornithine cyclodeaminase/alanine dehydrogenase-like protein (mu-crystallin family)
LSVVAMPLTVLTDGDIREILLSLGKDEANELQTNLAEALHSYSTGDTNSACCASYQPGRTQVKKRGITTLFMPATTGDAVGMKIVSLETPEGPPSKKSSISSHSTDSSLKSVRSDLSNMTLSPSTTVSSNDSVSGSGFQPPPSIASAKSTNPRGTVTMMDTQGNPMGILNAEELTAFRTALASTILFQKREHVHTITVFGAGRQAFWHVRLALLFKGDQIKHVNIINRSLERSLQLMKSFQPAEGESNPWRSDVKFSALSPEFGEYGRLLKDEVRKADAIFCCTPSTEPLFPPEFLTSHNGQRKGRYISAIGSYAPHMTELHPDIFKHATSTNKEHQNHHHPHFKQAKKSGVVIVDSLEGCLKEAGEIIQAKLRPEHLVELGELMMIKKSVMKEMELGGEGEKGLKDWLFKGNVIYKSVGLGLMDLTVGADLIRLAKEKDIGVHVDDF